MKQWEYLVRDGFEIPLNDSLNKLGEQGWELVSTCNSVRAGVTRLIFKREKGESNEPEEKD